MHAAQSSIFRRIALGAFAISLVACLGVGTVAYHQAKQGLFQGAAAELEAVASSQARAIETVVENYKDRIVIIATEVRLFQAIEPGSGGPTLGRLLRESAAVDDSIVQLTITDERGGIVTSTVSSSEVVAVEPNNSSVSDDAGVWVHGIVVSPSSAHMLGLSAPIGNGDRLYAWLDPRDLYAIVQDYTGLGDTGETMIAFRNADGNALFLTPIRFDPKAALTRSVDKTRLDVPMTQALMGNEITMAGDTVDYLGNPVIGVTRYLPTLDWGLVAKIHLSEVEQPIQMLRNWIVGITVAVLGFAAIFSLWFSRGITSPIRSMTEASQKIASGAEDLRLPVLSGDDFGRLAESVNVVLDRLQSTSEQSESHSALHEAVLQTVVDGVVTIDQAGNILTYNTACESIFGYRTEEVIGQPVTMLMPRHFAIEHDDYINNYIETGKKKIIGIGREVEGKRKSGEVFPLDLAVGSARHGNEMVFVGVLKDITDRKALEQANVRNVEVIRLLQRITAAANQADSLESVAEVVLQQICAHLRWPIGHLWKLDGEGGAASKADRLWYLADPLSFAPFREATDALQLEMIESEAGQAQVSGESVWVVDLARDLASPRRNAAETCGLHSGFAVPIDVGGKAVAILEFFTTDVLSVDKEMLRIAGQVAAQLGRVYERVRNTAILTKREYDLSRTNKHLEDFAYVASHDLKAPLRGIDNLAQWIAEDLEASMTEESLRHFDRLFGRVKRLERLVDDLLAFSRAGRIKQRMDEVDCAAIIGTHIDSLDLPASAEVVLAPDLPTFRTYRVPLETVFRNLIGNAIKHHDSPEMRIAVSWEEQDDHIVFTVTDNGPGIPKDYHERIFGLFQTLKPRDDMEASGMGLAVVRRLVEAVGGRIWVNSVPEERWTCFSFSWPRTHKDGYLQEDPDEQHQAA